MQNSALLFHKLQSGFYVIYRGWNYSSSEGAETLLTFFTYNTKYFRASFYLLTYVAHYCRRVLHKSEPCRKLSVTSQSDYAASR
jgi:hypothetical protein